MVKGQANDKMIEKIQLILYYQLSEAIKKEDIEYVENLLMSGADVNFINYNNNRETPLHDAVGTGNPKIVSLLLNNGADTEAIDADGNNAIDLCLLLEDEKKQAVEAIFKKFFKHYRPIQKNSESAPIEPYKKRHGTTAVGEFYETKLLTMVLFRLIHDDLIEYFCLANNLDEAGSFDDIVIKIRIGDKSQVICLQAKHKDTGCIISNENLFDMKDKNLAFNLKKYFESYLKIKYMNNKENNHPIFKKDVDQTELKMIIFTPAKLNDTSQYEEVSNWSVLKTHDTGKCFRIKCIKKYFQSFINFSKEWHEKEGINIPNNFNGLKESEEINPETQYQVVLQQLSSNIKTSKDERHSKKSNNQQKNQNVTEFPQETFLSIRDHKEIVIDFFNNLYIHSEQAMEQELDEIIRYDIKNENYERADLVFSKSLENIERWWKKSRCTVSNQI